MRPKQPTKALIKVDSPGSRDIHARLSRDSAFAGDFFQAMAEASIPAQMTILRRLRGLSQKDLASQLKVNQPFLSRLEAEGEGHRLENYEAAAKALGARLCFVPRGGKVVFAAEMTDLWRAR